MPLAGQNDSLSPKHVYESTRARSSFGQTCVSIQVPGSPPPPSNCGAGQRRGVQAYAAVSTICNPWSLGAHARGNACELSETERYVVGRLQGDDLRGMDDRIHCSLNINTETGRLSARRPNLQNQPALEKDRCVGRPARSSS